MKRKETIKKVKTILKNKLFIALLLCSLMLVTSVYALVKFNREQEWHFIPSSYELGFYTDSKCTIPLSLNYNVSGFNPHETKTVEFYICNEGTAIANVSYLSNAVHDSKTGKGTIGNYTFQFYYWDGSVWHTWINEGNPSHKASAWCVPFDTVLHCKLEVTSNSDVMGIENLETVFHNHS